MDEEEKRPERIREEVEPQSGDPQMAEVDEVAREGQLIGKVDDAASRAARHFTGDGTSRGQEGTASEPLQGQPMQESGRGETIALDSDAQRRMSPGDELVVRLPEAGADAGWTYELEGDDGILGVSERAELVVHGEQEQRYQPAAGNAFQFVVHAAGSGKAAVRFERLGQGGSSRAGIRLQVEVG